MAVENNIESISGAQSTSNISVSTNWLTDNADLLVQYGVNFSCSTLYSTRGQYFS